MIDFYLYYVDKNHSALILQLWVIIFSIESIITFSINLQPQLFIVVSPSQLLELHVYCGSKFHPSTHWSGTLTHTIPHHRCRPTITSIHELIIVMHIMLSTKRNRAPPPPFGDNEIALWDKLNCHPRRYVQCECHTCALSCSTSTVPTNNNYNS